MLKALIKKQLYELNRSFFYDQRTGRLRPRGLSIAFIALYVLLLAFVGITLFGLAGLALGGLLHEAGLDWLYFAVFGTIGIAFGAFGSVFNTFASLYQARDNDLLLSLPISVTAILVTRLSGVYLMGALFSGLAIVPGVVVYCITVACTPGVVIGGVLLFAVCSLIVLVLSCGLGWVVAKINAHLKHKSLISVIASVAFIAAYYYIYFNASTLLGKIAANASTFGDSLSAVYPLYLLGRLGLGDPLAVLIWTVGAAALVVLVWLLLSRSFFKLATATGRNARVASRRQQSKVRSRSAALLAREARRIGSSATCMLNCYIGTLLMSVGCVALAIKGRALIASLLEGLAAADIAPQAPVLLLTAIICLLIGMNTCPVSTISLEGRNLWLLQSLPITPWQVLRAKLQFHLLTTSVPALACSVCVIVVTGCTDAALAFAVLLMPQAAVLFFGTVGLALNLKRPNLNWVNETAVVKQGLCVLLIMLIGMVFSLVFVVFAMIACALVGAGLTWLPSAVVIVFALVTLLATLPLYRWLRRRGCEIFATL